MVLFEDSLIKFLHQHPGHPNIDQHWLIPFAIPDTRWVFTSPLETWMQFKYHWATDTSFKKLFLRKKNRQKQFFWVKLNKKW